MKSSSCVKYTILYLEAAPNFHPLHQCSAISGNIGQDQKNLKILCLADECTREYRNLTEYIRRHISLKSKLSFNEFG